MKKFNQSDFKKINSILIPIAKDATLLCCNQLKDICTTFEKLTSKGKLLSGNQVANVKSIQLSLCAEFAVLKTNTADLQGQCDLITHLLTIFPKK